MVTEVKVQPEEKNITVTDHQGKKSSQVNFQIKLNTYYASMHGIHEWQIYMYTNQFIATLYHTHMGMAVSMYLIYM